MYRIASRMTSNLETVVFREIEGTKFFSLANSTAVEAVTFSTPDPDWTPLSGSGDMLDGELGAEEELDSSRLGELLILTTILNLCFGFFISKTLKNVSRTNVKT